MSDRPDFLVSGERARLFPVLADTSKEGRTLSIFLSCLCNVDELGRSLLASIGKTAGKRSTIEAFTEVVLKSTDDTKCRPDGLVIVRSGKQMWSALIEAKIGNADVDPLQIETYAKLAKDNGIDAVVTISNQFVTRPEQHPVKIARGLSNHVSLFHWSWMYLVTAATLLLATEDVADTDQQYMLREFLRFLRHPSSGVTSFERMNTEWKDLVGGVRAGAKLSKTAPEVERTVANWHQEARNLCLIMSRRVEREVNLKLSPTQLVDPVKRLRDDCTLMSEDERLECLMKVPDAAALLHVQADVKTRCVNVGMALPAPTDKVSAKARVNWLLRQLTKIDPTDIYVRARWPGRAASTQASLADLRETPDLLVAPRPKMSPHSFEVILVRDLGAKFSGTRTFIEGLEEAVPAFYERVGQNLRAWQPPAPQIKTESDRMFQEPAVGAGTAHEEAPVAVERTPTVAARNTADFAVLDARTVNPFDGKRGV